MDALGVSVLVVDDEDGLCRAIALRFRAQGFDVRCVHTGGDALVEMRVRSPDLVILDLALPGVDGLGVLREIRHHGYGMPVVVLSANASEPVAKACLELGAKDYLTKPIDLKLLDVVVRALVAAYPRSSAR